MDLEPYDRFRRALDWASRLGTEEAPATHTAKPAAGASDQRKQAPAIETPIPLPPVPSTLTPVKFGPGFVRLSDRPRSGGVQTRWGGRLINREVTLLVGDGGVGKGLLAAWVAAQITSGRGLPDETEYHDPMHVCVVTFEDSLEVWEDRFTAAGGDKDALILYNVEDFTFQISELHTLGQKWGCVIIDPALLLCSAEGINPNDNRRVREMLQRLQRVAQRLDCPVLVVHHPNSRGSILGGPTWRNAVRSVLELGVQADDSLGLLHTKHNNVQKQAPLWYRLAVVNNMGVLHYLGTNENLKPFVKRRPKAGDDDGSARINEQLTWLYEMLGSHNGDISRGELLKAWSAKTGLSDRTLRTVISLAEKQGDVVRVKLTSTGTQSNEWRIKIKAVHEHDQVVDAFMENVDQELHNLIGDDEAK